MKNYRIMRHRLAGGTTIALDRIKDKLEAEKLCLSFCNLSPESHYFVMEYEEARHLPDVNKPRMKRRAGLWYCESYKGTACGVTPTTAYYNWMENCKNGRDN